MENRKQQIDGFFDAYGNRFNEGIRGNVSDIESTADLYSDCFIAADPSGVRCGRNDKQFRDAMLSGYAFYKKIGITSMEIISKEITVLDDFHSMARINWWAGYTRKDGVKGSIGFENIYFIQTKESRHKVFAYITGDEQAVLKELGLI